MVSTLERAPVWATLGSVIAYCTLSVGVINGGLAWWMFYGDFVGKRKKGIITKTVFFLPRVPFRFDVRLGEGVVCHFFLGMMVASSK